MKKTLSSREKYNRILPVLFSIGTLAASHGTDKFLSYLAELKEVEKNVRGGTSIQEKAVDEEDDEREESPHTNIALCSPTSSPSNACADEAGEEEHVDGGPKGSGKFKNLTFRKKLKARGRPRRADRQLCSFNRS